MKCPKCGGNDFSRMKDQFHVYCIRCKSVLKIKSTTLLLHMVNCEHCNMWVHENDICDCRLIKNDKHINNKENTETSKD